MAHSVDDRISIVYIGNLPDMIRILQWYVNLKSEH